MGKNKINEFGMKAISGRDIHRYLMKESFKKYKNLGYDVFLEKKVAKNCIADVYAEKKSERIIIECLTKPSLKYVIEKTKYKNHCDKFEICYPYNFQVNFPIEMYCDSIDLVVIPEDILKNQLHKVIQIKASTWRGLNKRKQRSGESFDDVLQRMILEFPEETDDEKHEYAEQQLQDVMIKSNRDNLNKMEDKQNGNIR